MNQNQAELLCSHQNYFTLTWVGINLVGSDYEALYTCRIELQNERYKCSLACPPFIEHLHRKILT